jgi:2-phosphoglycerate kinase
MFQMVATLDRDAYRSRFPSRATRARERAPEKYLRHFDEILEIQDHILGEADRYDLPIIDNVHFDEAVRSVIRSVIGTLQKSIEGKGRKGS